MPVILRIKGYSFFFYSNEGTPLEPQHIHVRNSEAELNSGYVLLLRLHVMMVSVPDNLLNWKVTLNITGNYLQRHGMAISAKHLSFDEQKMWVELSDGRTLGVPLEWFPKLLHADQVQRANYELSARGIHWDTLNEDISVEGLLAGRGDTTFRPHDAA